MLERCDCGVPKLVAREWEVQVFAARVFQPWLDSLTPSSGSQRHPDAICQGSKLRGALVLKPCE